jgi:hypothetical protein
MIEEDGMMREAKTAHRQSQRAVSVIYRLSSGAARCAGSSSIVPASTGFCTSSRYGLVSIATRMRGNAFAQGRVASPDTRCGQA